MIRLLLAILGLLALADRADASGCHVPDRPTFGLAGEPSSPDLDHETLVDQPPHYRHAPCPGESAGPPSKFQAPNASPTPSSFHGIEAEVGHRWPEVGELARPSADHNPLERPPRPSPAA